MRTLVLCAVLSFAVSASAQYGSTGYSIERWDEDYSNLKDPANRTDLFDPLKYVPLSQSEDWYLSFGGQARYRYDYFNNTSFGKGIQDEDGFHLVRLMPHVDAHFGSNFRVFLQLVNSTVNGRAGGPRPGDVDTFDFQQAFADVKLPLDDARSLTVRLGRQELIYGAQRLISPNDWGNVRRTFEGAKVSLSLPNDTLDLFWVRPVVIEKNKLNSGDDHTSFAGIYNVTALPEFLPSAASKLDLYVLALNKTKSNTVAVDSNTYTAGARLHSRPAPWDFDVEADGQFGSYDSHAIGAWALAAEGGYTFSNVMFTPRASLGIDTASGSPNPAHRFNQLFPPLYLYLGHIYIFGRENIIDLHPGLTFNLTKDLTLSADEHIFWRQNTHDGVYSLTSALVRGSPGSSAAYVGNEFDVVLNWQIQRHISAYLGYAHFFCGDFIRQTGAHADVDFLYAAVTLTF